MSDWQIGNKDWMKKRREHWKKIPIRLERFSIEKKEKPAIKKYFLTGEIDPDFPIEKMSVGLLFELWLHPDHSEQRWHSVMERYKSMANTSVFDDSKSEFARVARLLRDPDLIGIEPDESFFDGQEERLFYLFELNDLAEGSRDQLSAEQLMNKAELKLPYARSYDNCLKKSHLNPYLIYRWEIPAWHEAMMLACEGDYLGLEWLIRDMCKVLNNPSEQHPLVLEMAQNIDAVLRDPKLKGISKNIQIQV